MNSKIDDYNLQYNYNEHQILKSIAPNINAKGSAVSKGKNKFSNIVVIYPPTIDWNWMMQRPQHLMKQFAENGFEVYYCNKSQLINKNSYKVLPNLTIINDNTRFITEVVPYLKKKGKKILLWVSWSKLHIYLDQYLPDFIVYDYIDDFSAWAPYLDKMVARANVIVSSSITLKNHIDERYPQKPSFLIPNGCDISHFKYSINPPPKPAEYLGHNGPIICYTGAWASWVDQDLIKLTAYSLCDALIAIIGPALVPFNYKIIKNIKFIGYKPYDILPRYIHYSDVCIIPFKINNTTLAANPIKMYEYLAAGKPVVSTNLPEAKNVPNVYIGNDSSEFISCIKNLLNSNLSGTVNSEKIDNWLNEQTWDNRFQKIIDMLNRIWLRDY